MVKKNLKSKNFNLISPVEQLKFDFFKKSNEFSLLDNINNNNLYLNVCENFDGIDFNKFSKNFKFLPHQ